MPAPSIVFTARFAASHFCVDIDVINELAEEMAPEDGCLSAIESLDENAETITAFIRHGLDYLDELLNQRRLDFMHEGNTPSSLPRMDT